jgi:hypothetical protein
MRREVYRKNYKKKYSIGVDRLRPKIFLYKKINPNNIKFGAIFLRHLKKDLNIVIIIGISLKILKARKLAREFCRTTKIRKGGVTI